MRVSVPGIPQAILNAEPSLSVKSISEAIERLTEFIGSGNVAILTGAGVSVDSGIRAYRGEDGRYMNPNYKPIFYHELIDSTEKGHAFRQRYWLRSYLGYPPVRDAQPNTTHFALAALQYTSHLSRIITQNVDGLHHKALRNTAALGWNSSRIRDSILELHGTLHRVHCNRGHSVDRDTFQEWLSAANPKWHQYAEELERTGTQPRTNPDGDVAVEQLGISYNDFVVPECPDCLLEDHRNSIHKPEVIFFGESIPKEVKLRSYQDVEQCERLLLMGTTLATYSAFRLLRHALELKKPVMLLNIGPTRADGIPGVEKLDVPSGLVMRDVARDVIGTRAKEDPVTIEMLRSGLSIHLHRTTTTVVRGRLVRLPYGRT
ncbi:DHS-like NAD/FAD-binding domain-containing protein [Flammula alnicola]|nr:DHS-like NAD/FAD-binding domain-containing protein [Flammula alnicola]